MYRLRRFLIFLIGLSLPFNNVALEFGERTWSLGTLAGMLYIVSMFPDITWIPKIKRFGKYILNPIYFAILLTGMNLLNINYDNTPIVPMTMFLCCLLFYFLLLHGGLDQRAFKSCLNGLGVGCILMAICFLLGFGVTVGDDMRLVMFGENANELGIYMCLGSMIIFNEWILNDSLKLKAFRYIFLAAYIPILVLLFVTGSRVAFLSFLMSFILIVCLYKTRNRRRKVFTILVTILVGVALFKFLLASDSIIIQRLLMTTEEGNLSGRDDIIKDLWPYVAQNYLFGVGQTGYVNISRLALGKTSVIGGITYGFSPHNVLIEILLYTGVVGLLLYSRFWYKVFKSAYYVYIAEYDRLSLLLLIPIAGCILSGQILTAKWAFVIYAYVIMNNVTTNRLTHKN